MNSVYVSDKLQCINNHCLAYKHELFLILPQNQHISQMARVVVYENY